MKNSFILLLSILSLACLIRLIAFYSQTVNYKDGQPILLQTRVLSDPKREGSIQRFAVNVPGGRRAFITLPLYPEIRYSEVVKIEGEIDVWKTEASEVLFINRPKVEKLPDSNPILQALGNLRLKIITDFERVLPSTSASLLLGIVFGIKEEFPTDFEANLRQVGIMHVIAASGMNITMLGGFLSSFLVRIFRRQTALILTITGICLYAFLSGLEPSIIRASIMGIIVFTAQILGRQTITMFSLYASALIMLIFQPSLIFDVGWQLSFMATLGIISLKPLIEKKMGKLIKKSLIGDDVTTTIVAQLFTLPILLLNFGSYSLWSVIVNALLLWTVPPLMVIGGLASIASLILGTIGAYIAYIGLPLLFYFQAIVNFFGTMGGSLEISSFPWQYILAYYLVLFALIFMRKAKL